MKQLNGGHRIIKTAQLFASLLLGSSISVWDSQTTAFFGAEFAFDFFTHRHYYLRSYTYRRSKIGCYHLRFAAAQASCAVLISHKIRWRKTRNAACTTFSYDALSSFWFHCSRKKDRKNIKGESIWIADKTSLVSNSIPKTKSKQTDENDKINRNNSS